MKISKVKLINWHAFENKELDYKGNLIFTGSNGSGKSTLMDAIYYVLSGGDTRNFNNAANNGDNHNSKRTLETYILHKIGYEGNECLRSRPIISHICLEFSQDDGTSFLLGAVIEVGDSNTVEKFYTKSNAHIEDSYFLSPTKQVFSFNELKHKMEAVDITKTSRKARQTLICKEILKLNDGSRYVDLLQRAIAFRPIDEVSDFVDSFLLDEQNIEINDLKNELRSYYGIYNQVRKTKEKIDYLGSFIDQAKKYKEYDTEVKFLKPLSFEARMDYNNVIILKLEQQNEELKKKNESLSASFESNDYKIMGLREEKKKVEESEVYKLVKVKKAKLEELEKDENQLAKSVSEYDNILKNEQTILNAFGLNYSFRKDIKENNFSLFTQHRKNYLDFVNVKRVDLATDTKKLNDNMKKVNLEIRDITEKISELEKGHNNYPDNVKRLQNVLQEHLRKKYNKEIPVRPLCECLEFKEKEMNRWSKAIEAYLANYRFGLIVDYKYYDECIELYESIKAKENIHDVSIFKTDTPLFLNLKSNENSLFSKLDIVDKRAKYLCYHLFNDVICYDSLIDLKKQDSPGLLDDCTIYRDYSFYIPDPKVYQFPYIGEESFRIRIHCLQYELEKKNEEYEHLSEELGKTEKLLEIIGKNKAYDIIRFDDAWTKYEETKESVSKIKKEIALYEDNPNIIALSKQIDALEEQIAKLRESNSNINEQISFNQRTIGGNETDIRNKEEDNVNNREAFNQSYYKIKAFSSQYDSYKEQYYDEKHHLLKDQIEKRHEACKSALGPMGASLKSKIHEYVTSYNNVLSDDLNDIDRIINEYEKLKSTDIVKFELKAEEAKHSSERMFRDDFISKLSGNIKAAKKTIDDINKNLARHPFGTNKEIYRFVCQPSKEEEMRQYYKIITSGKLMEAKDLFSEVLSEEENNVMNNLFNKIATSGDDSTDEKLLSKLLDYRKYMTYDIETTNERGEKTLFSKTHREKSGGETQTPFYVIIASCFDQLMDKKKGYSSCPVIFDEAFNNMDETRIDALMRYYRELGIQLIIVVPSNRLASLAQFVDTIAGLVAKDHQVDIYYLNNEANDDE